ncbi:hypothetical protein GCM10027294_41220 [Marinactinospora endophytica]
MGQDHGEIPVLDVDVDLGAAQKLLTGEELELVVEKAVPGIGPVLGSVEIDERDRSSCGDTEI